MKRRGVRGVAACLGVALVFGCGNPPSPPGEDGGPVATTCTTDSDCDDGLFCSGTEACMPGSDSADARGCVTTASCLDSQRCNEEENRCVTSCAVSPDADGDGVEAESCGGADCDDTDPRRHPGATEVCDDGDRDEDCDPRTFGDTDADGDGYIDAACCNASDTGMSCGLDCNDTRRDAHPGATEACEGIDNDCDGSIDEGLLVPQYPDADFDLHGVTGPTTPVCPGAPGWSTVGDDCDDANPVRHGAQLEICDSLDNDCDGLTDEAPVSVSWYPDEDGDGFGAPPADTSDVVVSCAPVDGYSTRSSDCDDSDANVRPGQRELCNAIDDDCNGRADAPSLGAGDLEDDDDDGFADVACGGSDCDDASGSVNRDAIELCNGIDDDCDGVTDGDDAMAMWYLDLDHDGWGEPTAPITSCEPQPGRVTRGGDCDDDDATIHPRAIDLCDGIDDDCDGETDENGVRFAFYPDADADGWGTSDLASIVFACTRPAGTSDRPGDCADTDATRYPTALEECDSVDDDCDGTVDEDSDRMWYADVDRDGHGAGAPVLACLRPSGRVEVGDDCDDANASNFPTNAETCDGADNDCDGTADDGADTACNALHATGTCTAGACSLTCATGYGDCDDDVTTGCEIDLRRSATDCGTCGMACGLADTCGRAPVSEGTCNRSPIVEMTGNGYYVIGRRATGGTFGWGRGSNGQHGLGSGVDAFAAGRGQVDDAVELSGGNDWALALTASGTVLSWGYNSTGQLGGGPGSPGSRMGAAPVLLPGPAAAACAGGQHGCAVLRDGHVYCWGSQWAGRLGNGLATSASVHTPVPARSMAGEITDAIDVSCGNDSTCVLRERAPGDRYVSCFGANVAGQLGIGTSGSGLQSEWAVDTIGLPTDLVAMNRGLTAAHCVWTSTGRALCWGDNSSATGYGLSLGTGGTGGPQPVPVTPPGLDSGVVDLMLHEEGGCAIKRSGSARELWCWGYGSSNGWPGDGMTTALMTPRLIGPTADRWTDVEAMVVGFTFVCAVRSDGDVYCIGEDGYGQLGDGAPGADSGTPVRVLNLP